MRAAPGPARHHRMRVGGTAGSARPPAVHLEARWLLSYSFPTALGRSQLRRTAWPRKKPPRNSRRQRRSPTRRRCGSRLRTIRINSACRPVAGVLIGRRALTATGANSSKENSHGNKESDQETQESQEDLQRKNTERVLPVDQGFGLISRNAVRGLVPTSWDTAGDNSLPAFHLDAR